MVDNGLCDQNLIANRAMLALSQARSGTSRLDSGINYIGVTKRIGFVCRVGIAAVAGISSISLCGTGGSGNNRLVIMSVGGNRGLCNENLATFRALFALGQTGGGTSGGNGIKNDNTMIVVVVR